MILVLRSMKRCTIVTAKPAYVHAEFRSALFGFVDDVTFVFDDDERLIHFRSASRTGYYDFGANRNRMKEISLRLYGSNPKKRLGLIFRVLAKEMFSHIIQGGVLWAIKNT